MGANVMCVTSAGGMPLFTRHVGNVEPLSFSAVGSMNGVHLFSKSHGATLINTHTETSTLVWKEYEESVVLIAVSVLNDEVILTQIIDTVFSAMVLTVGIDDLKNIKNVERLKRELRPSYAVIDKILEGLDFGDRCIGNSTQILKYVETLICSEAPSLQYLIVFSAVVRTVGIDDLKTIKNVERLKRELRVCLDSFVENVSSLFGCVTIENCLATATQAWWDLEHVERKLLSHIISANANCTAFDIPVFLPCKSPNVPFRLVGVCLISGIWVCVLCGPKPDISSVQQSAFQLWSPLGSTLKAALNVRSRNIPSSIQIHPSVHGFLLVDIKNGKYLSSICSTLNRKESRSPSEVLKTFYYQAASLLCETEVKHKPIETYWCSEFHKVHALRKDCLILCLMYSSSVPTHTMRLISEETFEAIGEY